MVDADFPALRFEGANRPIRPGRVMRPFLSCSIRSVERQDQESINEHPHKPDTPAQDR